MKTFNIDDTAMILIDHRVGTNTWASTTPIELLQQNVIILARFAGVAENPARGVIGAHQEPWSGERVGRPSFRRCVPEYQQKELRHDRGKDGCLHGVAGDQRSRGGFHRQGGV